MALFLVATLLACTISIGSCDSPVKLLEASLEINKKYGRLNYYELKPTNSSDGNALSSGAQLTKDIPQDALIECLIYAEEIHGNWTKIAHEPAIHVCKALKSGRVPYGIDLVGLSNTDPKVKECPVKAGKFFLVDFVPTEDDLPTNGGGIYRVLTTWYSNSKDTEILKWNTTYEVGIVITK